jgi:hypothetical protein
MSGTVAAREYQEVFEKNQTLQRQMLALSEENIEFKFENEQFRKDVPRLKVFIKTKCFKQTMQLCDFEY